LIVVPPVYTRSRVLQERDGGRQLRRGHGVERGELLCRQGPVVAESGLSAPADLKRLAGAHVTSVLVGESLMRQKMSQRRRGNPSNFSK
jgi:hypothetical protein